MQEEFQGDETRKKAPYQSELFEWGEALVVSLTFVIVLFVFFLRLMGVDGDSMFPTLHDRDQLLISNLFYEPHYGDIVVLRKDSFMEKPIVKRVIATEGQIVDIDFTSGVVLVDDTPLDEPYTNDKTYLTGDLTFPMQVPENNIFVLGDNRGFSSDSRLSSLGMVDERYILGRVLMRVMPISRFGSVEVGESS